jgi:phosphoenolpyruvate carboxylase
MKSQFNQTREMILFVTDQKEILGNNGMLQRSIQLRNPYVDPLSYIQVEPLRRLAQKTCPSRNGPILNKQYFSALTGLPQGCGTPVDETCVVCYYTPG